MADLLVHLSEVEERGLHRARACSSLYSYCVEVLHYSEYAAIERVRASRVVRAYSLALTLLREGALHLTALMLLAPVLDAENHERLLVAAKHKTKREVEELVACLKPRKPVRDGLRKLTTHVQPLGPAAAVADLRAAPPGMPLFAPRPGTKEVATPSTSAAKPAANLMPPAEMLHSVRFVANAHLKRKLDRARALASHRLPNDGELAALFELALDALIEKLAKQREGAVEKPREPREQREPRRASADHSRYVPRAVRRAVYARDGHRCAFISPDGRRCSETTRLELHHVHPFALGGATTVENLSLRCRSHNAHESELVFGAA